MNFVTWKYNPFKLENSYVNNCSEKKDFFITVNTIEIVTFTGKQHLLNTRCKSTKKNKKPSDFIIKIKGKPLLLLFSDSQTHVLIAFYWLKYSYPNVMFSYSSVIFTSIKTKWHIYQRHKIK